MLQLTDLGARKRAEAYPLWERVQRTLADEFGDDAIDDLLERLRRLQAGSARLFRA
jgi:hypothetical protein